MDIMERIDILKECGLVDEQGYQDLITIKKVFQDQFNIVLTEENAGIMVTHIAAAFKRLETKEEIIPLDDSVLEQLKEETVFEKSKQILENLRKEICNKLSYQEEKFILVHICNVLS